MCGGKERLIESVECSQGKELDNGFPVCPQCGSNKKVVKNDDQHTLFQMFVAKPFDEYFCLDCHNGFGP